jgi:hypothetical protein
MFVGIEEEELEIEGRSEEKILYELLLFNFTPS